MSIRRSTDKWETKYRYFEEFKLEVTQFPKTETPEDAG
jgi:hypothetical protein